MIGKILAKGGTTLLKCPFCSQDNLVGAQFCDNCGASLKQGSQIQKYVAAARLEPAPSPTPIFPSRHKAAPAPVAPAYAAAPTPAAPAYAVAPAPAAPAYAAAPTPAAPAYAAAPAPVAPAYAAAPAPVAPAYAAAPAPVAPAYAAAPTPAAPAYAAAPAPVAPAYAAAPTPVAPAYAAASTGGYASFTDSDSGRVFCLNSDKILLGRGPGQLDDGLKLDFEGLRGGATVSKRHALLRHDVTGVFIEDVGSGNGTFINGERLPQGIERGLNDGDRLRLGAVLLNFVILNHKK